MSRVKHRSLRRVACILTGHRSIEKSAGCHQRHIVQREEKKIPPHENRIVLKGGGGMHISHRLTTSINQYSFPFLSFFIETRLLTTINNNNNSIP